MQQALAAFLQRFIKDNPKWAKAIQLVFGISLLLAVLLDGAMLPQWLEFIEHKAVQIAEVIGIALAQYPNKAPDYSE